MSHKDSIQRQAYASIYYQANKDRIKARSASFAQRHKYDPEYRIRRLVDAAKWRAKRYGIAFDIDASFVLGLFTEQEGLCSITKMPMTFKQVRGRSITNVSIDRINPISGYTKGNVRLVCDIVNIMKSTLSDVELVDWCQKILDGMHNV